MNNCFSNNLKRNTIVYLFPWEHMAAQLFLALEIRGRAEIFPLKLREQKQSIHSSTNTTTKQDTNYTNTHLHIHRDVSFFSKHRSSFLDICLFVKFHVWVVLLWFQTSSWLNLMLCPQNVIIIICLTATEILSISPLDGLCVQSSVNNAEV